jgi:hypothetical protein
MAACGPGVEIERAVGQARESRLGEAIFNVRLTEPPAGNAPLGPSAFIVTGTASVDEVAVETYSTTRYRVKVRVSGPGDVFLSTLPGAFTDNDGKGSAASTTSTGTDGWPGNKVRFAALGADPSTVVLVPGQTRTVTLQALAELSSVVNVTVVPPAGVATVSPASVELTAAAPAAEISVTAANLSGGGEGLVTFTVTSTDPTFDGMPVPPIRVIVLSAPPPPDLRVTKLAYINLPDDADPSDPVEVAAAGQPVASGGQLAVNTRVWWVYTAANFGGVAYDVAVVDSVEGEVCQFEAMPAGGDPVSCVLDAVVTVSSGA